MNEMLYFFTYLMEKHGIIDPNKILEEEQNQTEINTRTNELMQHFNNVRLNHEVYPYKNNFDDEGKLTRKYFHAIEKK